MDCPVDCEEAQIDIAEKKNQNINLEMLMCQLGFLFIKSFVKLVRLVPQDQWKFLKRIIGH